MKGKCSWCGLSTTYSSGDRLIFSNPGTSARSAGTIAQGRKIYNDGETCKQGTRPEFRPFASNHGDAFALRRVGCAAAGAGTAGGSGGSTTGALFRFRTRFPNDLEVLKTRGSGCAASFLFLYPWESADISTVIINGLVESAPHSFGPRLRTSSRSTKRSRSSPICTEPSLT